MFTGGLKVRGSDLMIGGSSARELVERFGSPLYVYDSETIGARVDQIRRHLPWFDIFYSVKANPNLRICRFLASHGCGAEIASDGELFLARQAGFNPEDIIFAGPGKTDAELEYSVREGIYAVNIESPKELARLDELAGRLGKRARAAIRVNTAETVEDAPEKMVGGSSKFGIDQERIIDVLSQLSLKNTDLVGIHVYTASGVLDEDELAGNVSRTLELARFIAQGLGFPLRCVDFGGGFGVPYSEDEKPLDFEKLSKAVIDVFGGRDPREVLPDCRLMFELGRFLVAESGVYLTKVIDVKESRGKRFVITDGGMNQMIRPVFMKLNHPTVIATKMNSPVIGKIDVGGPCCTPIDMLAQGIDAPDVREGDLIALLNSGAYGYSMSMLYFLSHPLPAEVFIEKGNPELARRRGSVEDCLINQVL